MSLSLISLLGMQTKAEGEEQRGYAEIRYGAPALVNDPDLLVKDASTRQDREPVNILSSIVFQEWNKPGSKSHAFQIQKA